jgi:hypothetical protein
VDPNALEANVWDGNDDLRLLCSLPAECVDLVYLDSPFFSNRAREDRDGAPAHLDWIAPSLEALHRILKPTGSLFLVCDEAVGLYLRVLLVELFGQRDARSRSASWKADCGAAHHYVFYYRKLGPTTPIRNGHLYTVVHREGAEDSSLVAFSFLRGRVRRRASSGHSSPHCSAKRLARRRTSPLAHS